MEFLKIKSGSLKVRIKKAEVGGRNFLARHCDGIRHSWLVEPKFVVTETFHKLPKLQDWGTSEQTGQQNVVQLSLLICLISTVRSPHSLRNSVSWDYLVVLVSYKIAQTATSRVADSLG